MKISEVTRRDIFDLLLLSDEPYYGRMAESVLLDRVFNLRNLPSNDRRCTNMLGDVATHRESFLDWEDDWVFHDSRLNLQECPDEVLLRFLCEILHPIVRPDTNRVEILKNDLNERLLIDGFEIVERSQISGKPIYAGRVLPRHLSPGLSDLKDKVSETTTDYLMRQITRLETGLANDPGLAIGTAKEVIETCCKHILSELGEEVTTNEDIGKLTRRTFRAIDLTPKDINDSGKADDSMRRLTGGLSSVIQGIAELRNSFGTGHGIPRFNRELSQTHARLVVGAATTLAVFLLETYEHGRRV